MSFVEKNKAWLLPLLLVGGIGVVYLNLRTFSGPPKPPPSEEPAGASASPDAAGAPAPPPATPSMPPPASTPAPAPTASSTQEAPSGPDVWADLRPLAVVPNPLGQDAELSGMARKGLDTKPAPPPTPVPRPAWSHEPRPQPRPKEGVPAEASGPPPEVDFLVRTPDGQRAWFDGRGYRSGERVAGTAYRVGPISSSSVELSGPKGPTRRWTNPLHRSGPKAPSPETP